MELDQMHDMKTKELLAWAVEPGRKDFDFWLACGMLTGRLNDPQLAHRLLDLALKRDRPVAEALLKTLI